MSQVSERDTESGQLLRSKEFNRDTEVTFCCLVTPRPLQRAVLAETISACMTETCILIPVCCFVAGVRHRNRCGRCYAFYGSYPRGCQLQVRLLDGSSSRWLCVPLPAWFYAKSFASAVVASGNEGSCTRFCVDLCRMRIHCSGRLASARSAYGKIKTGL